ncbi:Clp protease N-terminal domain-containing protein [Streptomyces sp. NPDC001606]
MFERFTKDARAVVDGAIDYAREGRAGTVGAEHLLLALLDREGSRASFALSALGSAGCRDGVRRALRETERRAGLTRAEADALAGLGIDVGEVVARVEEAHGAGAMSGGADGHRAGGRRRSGRRPGFGRDAKGVLKSALRVAVARRERHLGDEHLLLALTALPGTAGEALADSGVTFEGVTRVCPPGHSAGLAGR